MSRAWPLLILAALAAGGCGQKGPLYLPDKAGKVVTNAPAAPASPAPASPAPDTPKAAAPEAGAPATPKATDKNQEQEQDQSSPPPK